MTIENKNLAKLVSGTVFFSIFFIAACVCTLVFLPADAENVQAAPLLSAELSAEPLEEINYENLMNEEYPRLEVSLEKKSDPGLTMYRQASSKAAVEWYYTRITGSREITQAILEEAENFNVPLSLAFALAYTESRYNITAMHKNTNGSIDRGLFQLNNASFPKLTESDFYNPKVSAHYGLSHLKFCLDTAGNEISALAMYNAGANKVRKNNTPQITLNYISQIQNYKSSIDDNFATEVLAFYNSDSLTKMLAKK